MKKLAALAVCVSLTSAGLLVAAPTAHATGTTTTEVSPVTETFKQRAERTVSEAALPEATKAKLRAVIAALPDDADQRVARLNAKLGIHDSQWAEIAGSVINPDDYQCEATPLQAWLDSTTADWGLMELIILLLTPIADLPTYDALLFGSESKSNTFGNNGQYTALLTAQMKDLRAFWDISGDDIQLVPMHGADLFADTNRLARVFGAVYDLTPERALEFAVAYQGVLPLAPGFRGGAHPIFTFNAFAVDPQDDPDLVALGVTKRIVMGDGIMQGYAAIGVDEKVAPRSILAHEYGHQVQFAKNLFESPLTGPEATRRTELMADALGTYFMVHSRGEALNATRTLADQKTFLNVGDCGFDSDGHHGTPNQRYNAAGWAVTVANSAADQGRQLQALPFASKFEAKLPELVAPDAR